VNEVTLMDVQSMKITKSGNNSFTSIEFVLSGSKTKSIGLATQKAAAFFLRVLQIHLHGKHEEKEQKDVPSHCPHCQHPLKGLKSAQLDSPGQGATFDDEDDHEAKKLEEESEDYLGYLDDVKSHHVDLHFNLHQIHSDDDEEGNEDQDGVGGKKANTDGPGQGKVAQESDTLSSEKNQKKKKQKKKQQKEDPTPNESKTITLKSRSLPPIHTTPPVHLKAIPNPSSSSSAFTPTPQRSLSEELVLFFPDPKVCRNFLADGTCRFGERCIYSHVKETSLLQFLRILGSAAKTLDICVYNISFDCIRDAILRAHERKVVVRIITDYRNSKDDPGSDVIWLAQKGISVIYGDLNYCMHHKFAVLDKKTVLNGSFNWTPPAVMYNQENVVVSSDPQRVKFYEEQFQVIWHLFIGA